MLMNTIAAKRHNVTQNGRHTYHSHSKLFYGVCVNSLNHVTHQAYRAVC
jgi:hypothetical protein